MVATEYTFIEKLAKLMYRERQSVDQEAQLRYDRRVLIFFSLTLFVVFGIFVFYFTADASAWYSMRPEVVVNKSQWRVLVDPLQNPRVHQDEWSKSQVLTDPQAKEKLTSGHNKKVWLKLELTPQQVAQAADRHAYYYRLGFLIGDIDIWVNSNKLVSIPNTYTGNIDVALPIYQIEKKEAMEILIGMSPRAGATNIVPLTLGVEAGLVAYHTGASFMRFNHFINRSRPLALFFVYSIFSLIFFLLWTGQRVQREYLHLSAYSLVNSLPPLLFSDAFTTDKLHDATAFSVYLSLVVLQAAAALSLGLSFARSHSKSWSRLIWSVVAIGVAAIWFLPSHVSSSIRQPLNQILLPLSFILGAAACFIQARWMSSDRSGLSLPKRVTSLYVFTGILAGLAVLYIVQFHTKFDYVTKQLLFDFPALLCLLFLGYRALSDYRQQSQLVKRIPMSVYHRRPQLPEKLSGLIVMIDLKNSESYFTYARHNAGFESVLPTALSHIWTIVNQFQGVVIKAEGDEVVAFFDDSQVENSLQQVLLATDRIERQLRIFCEELQSQYEGLESHQMHFRAAVARGDVRPTWVEGASGRLPAWVQVGDSMAFVEAARLMELEKVIESAEPSSRVLVSTSLVKTSEINFSVLSGEFLLQQYQLVGKHNRFYTVDLYRAGVSSNKGLRLVS